MRYVSRMKQHVLDYLATYRAALWSRRAVVRVLLQSLVVPVLLVAGGLAVLVSKSGADVFRSDVLDDGSRPVILFLQGGASIAAFMWVVLLIVLIMLHPMKLQSEWQKVTSLVGLLALLFGLVEVSAFWPYLS